MTKKKDNTIRGDVDGMLLTAINSFPHLRVGQLLVNALDHFKQNHPELYRGDMYYLPDDLLAVALEQYINDFWRNES